VAAIYIYICDMNKAEANELSEYFF
jgi:hypothetical protein